MFLILILHSFDGECNNTKNSRYDIIMIYCPRENIYHNVKKHRKRLLEQCPNNKSDVFTIYYSYTIVFTFYFRSVCFPSTVELK